MRQPKLGSTISGSGIATSPDVSSALVRTASLGSAAVHGSGESCLLAFLHLWRFRFGAETWPGTIRSAAPRRVGVAFWFFVLKNPLTLEGSQNVFGLVDDTLAESSGNSVSSCSALEKPGGLVPRRMRSCTEGRVAIEASGNLPEVYTM